MIARLSSALRSRLARRAPAGEGAGAGRRTAGDDSAAYVTSGDSGVTGGGRSPWLLASAGAAVIAAVTGVNIATRLHDRPDLAAAGKGWTIPVDEISSGVVAAAMLPVALWILRTFPPRRDRWRSVLAGQAAASVVFALVHVGGFVLLRKLVYAAQGEAYVFGGLGEFLYEYRKDALAYALGATLFIGADLLLRRPTMSAPASEAPPAVFDIREGARTLRTPVAEIAAVSSAGNYVEFRLTGGRRPLMRTTLAAVEVELAGRGFVRTHRSWLVNAAAVREIAPAGSGDFRLVLEGGTEAPLSRRFETALARLRG